MKIRDFLKCPKSSDDVPQDLSKDFQFIGGPHDGLAMAPLGKQPRYVWMMSPSAMRYCVYETVAGNRQRFVGYAGEIGEMPIIPIPGAGRSDPQAHPA